MQRLAGQESEVVEGGDGDRADQRKREPGTEGDLHRYSSGLTGHRSVLCSVMLREPKWTIDSAC